MRISKSFTAVGLGPTYDAIPGDVLSYSVSGTFVGTWQLILTHNNSINYTVLDSGTAAKTGKIIVPTGAAGKNLPRYLFRCSAYTSGTIVTSISSDASTAPLNPAIGKTLQAVTGKAGATAGWVTADTTDISTMTCPESQTASTLVIPLDKLRLGDVLTGFHLMGQITSAGGEVTLDAQLRSQTVTASGVTDALVDSMTQVSVTASTLLNLSNTGTALTTDRTVVEGVTYYLLITATTAASTSIALLGAAVTYQPA